MCGPAIVPIAAAGMAATAVGGIMSSQGQKQAAAAQNAYYGSLADNDEKMAGLTLDSAERNRGLLNEQASRDTATLHNEANKFAASQKAGMAASGVALSSVTAQDIARDTVDKASMDEAAIRYNADMKIYESENQAKIQAWQLQEKAKQERFAGANALQAGNINSTATLLGTAGSMSSQLMSFGGTSAGKRMFG